MERTHPEILTPLQRRVLDTLFEEETFQKFFYLTSGTALAAFYLYHRYSDDLDFFTNSEAFQLVWPTLQRLLPELGLTVDSRTPQFIRLRHSEGLRVDFVQDVPFRVGVPVRHGVWLIDTLENITLNKISAIQGRLDIKDYVDLYFLLKDEPKRILTLLVQAKQKDSSIQPFIWSRLIADAETFRVLPRMVVPLRLEAVAAFYRHLRSLVLSSLEP